MSLKLSPFSFCRIRRRCLASAAQDGSEAVPLVLSRKQAANMLQGMRYTEHVKGQGNKKAGAIEKIRKGQ